MALFETQITIAAPAEVVYRHLTEADGLLRWMAVEATSDPRPGGVLRWTHENGATMIGRFVELVPHERVVFRYGWENDLMDVPPASTIVEITLRASGGMTELSLTHRELPDSSVDEHAVGWRHFLHRLAAHVADPTEPT